jgi:hypothetical protein
MSNKSRVKEEVGNEKKKEEAVQVLTGFYRRIGRLYCAVVSMYSGSRGKCWITSLHAIFSC